MEYTKTKKGYAITVTTIKTTKSVSVRQVLAENEEDAKKEYESGNGNSCNSLSISGINSLYSTLTCGSGSSSSDDAVISSEKTYKIEEIK